MKTKKTEKDTISRKVDLKMKKSKDEFKIPSEKDDDILDEYDPTSDPEHIIIFDCELDSFEDIKAIDLLYLVDTTASMNCYLKGIKKLMRKIIWDIQKCLSKYLLEEIDVLRIGIVSYKDHGDEDKTYLTNIDIDLTGNYKEVDNVIKSLTCGGGKDEPEAVLDGLSVALYDMNWREESIKYIFHILDAPCHGKKYNNIEGDKYESCPKNIEVEELLSDLRNKEINYSVIQLNDSTDLMIKEFQKNINVEILSTKVHCDKSEIMAQD
jgi:hypothetical protein